MNEKAISSNADGCLILILPLAFTIIVLFATWPLLLALFVLTIGWKVWQRYQWQQWSQQVNPVFHRLIQENQGTITALDLAIKGNFSAAIAKQYLDTKAQEFSAQRQELENQATVYYFIISSTLGSIFDKSEPEDNDYTNVSPTPSSRVSTKTKDQTEPLLLAENQTSLPNLHLSEAQANNIEVATEALVSSENQNQLQPENSNHYGKASEHEPEALERQNLAFVCLIQSELAKRLDVHSSTVYKRRDDPDFPEWTRLRDPEKIAWKYLPDTKLFSPVVK